MFGGELKKKRLHLPLKRCLLFPKETASRRRQKNRGRARNHCERNANISLQEKIVLPLEKVKKRPHRRRDRDVKVFT